MKRRILDEIGVIGPRLAGTFGASGASMMLGLLSGTLAARYLGPSHRGDLAQLLLWPQLVATVGSLGIELSAVYLSGDPARRRDVPATTIAISLAQSLVLVPAYLVLVPFVYAGSGLTREALLMAPLIPMYLLGAVAIDVLAGRLPPITGALAYVAAHGCGDALALALVWRESRFGRFDRALAHSAVRFGAKSHLGRLSPQSLGIDVAVIALLLSSRDLGLYAVASAFLAAPGLVASSIGMVVFPQASAAHQSGRRPQLHATFALHAAAVIAMAALMVVLARPLITLLFGDSYAGATLALRLLALGAVASSIRAFPIEVLRGVGRPGLTSIAEAANWLCFAIAIPLGATFGGLTGVAAAVAAASYASLLALAVIAWRAGFVTRPAAAPRIDALEAA
jgi:PST family polysaccharide transporter